MAALFENVYQMTEINLHRPEAATHTSGSFQEFWLLEAFRSVMTSKCLPESCTFMPLPLIWEQNNYRGSGLTPPPLPSPPTPRWQMREASRKWVEIEAEQ